MKYNEDLVENITSELKKVPNIRYVCSKVGIDHSTLYRWRMKHLDFEKRLTMAMYVGRELINDVAESNIIKGVQSGDIKCSTYWLSHNSPNYAENNSPLFNSYKRIEKLMTRNSRKSIGDFQILFDALFKLESTYDLEIGTDKMVNILISKYLDYDQELFDLFIGEYHKWKIRLIKEQACSGKENIEDILDFLDDQRHQLNDGRKSNNSKRKN